MLPCTLGVLLQGEWPPLPSSVTFRGRTETTACGLTGPPPDKAAIVGIEAGTNAPEGETAAVSDHPALDDPAAAGDLVAVAVVDRLGDHADVGDMFGPVVAIAAVGGVANGSGLGVMRSGDAGPASTGRPCGPRAPAMAI